MAETWWSTVLAEMKSCSAIWALVCPSRSGRVRRADGGSGPAGLNACRTVSNEQFDTHANLPNIVELESRTGFSDSGFCMDVPGASKTPGLQLQLFDRNGSLAQRWVVGFTSS